MPTTAAAATTGGRAQRPFALGRVDGGVVLHRRAHQLPHTAVGECLTSPRSHVLTRPRTPFDGNVCGHGADTGPTSTEKDRLRISSEAASDLRFYL